MDNPQSESNEQVDNVETPIENSPKEESEKTLSLRGHLEKELKGQEERPEPEDNTEEGDTEESEESLSDQDSGEEEDVEKEEEYTEEDAKKEFPLIPSEFTDKEKEVFEQAIKNPELKDQAGVLLERYEHLKDGFYKKSADIARRKKDIESWDGLFKNYESNLRAVGQTPQEWTAQVMQSVISLQRNPTETIKSFMTQFNIKPEDLGVAAKAKPLDKKDDYGYDYDDYDDYDDPMDSRIAGKIDDLESKFNNLVTEKEKQEQQIIQTQIETFGNSKDSKGNLKYPMFSDTKVRREMSLLMQMGDAKTLEEAYEKSPSVREASFSRKKTAEELEAELDNKRRKAKKAKSMTVLKSKNSGLNGATVPADKSIRSLLKAGFEGV